MISERYIAMMDILGFREMVSKKPLMKIVDAVDNLFTKIADVSIPWSLYSRGNPEISDVGEVRSGITQFGKAHFSDTLVLWTCPIDKCDDVERRMEEHTFILAITNIMFHSFFIGLPLRVGVAFGEVYIDEGNQTIVGQPVIDAYQVELSQEWVGGALHPNCPIHTLPGTIINYPVPVKDGHNSKLELALDWTGPIQWPDWLSEKEFGFSYRQRFMDMLREYIHSDLPDSARIKYINTQTFIDERIRMWIKSQR